MTLSLFLKIKAVISLFFGLGMLFVNPWMMPIYGISLNRAGTMLSQWNGAFMIGIGLICWTAAVAPKSDFLKGILLALFICDTIGFVTSLLAQLSGVTNALAWSSVGIWFLLAVGLGWFRFFSTEE